MDTVRQSKVFATVSLMLGLFVSGSTVWAGPSSVLDPYVEIAPPSGRAAKQQRPLMPESTAVETSTTYVNMDGDAKPPAAIRIKKPHFSMGGNTVKPEKQTVAKTKVEKIKTAKVDTQKVQSKKTSVSSTGDDGMKTKLVDGTKSIGDGVASGTKKVGDGITSGAKASGSFFMKGAKAIGFKGDDKKDKDTKAVASKKAEPETKLGEDRKPNSDTRLVADKKTEAKSEKKKESKKKNGGVLSPISNIFKGTGDEIKDGLHAATDKLSITKPKPGKDSAAERVAEDSAKKHKNAKSELESTYVAKGHPVKEKKSSDGNGLVSKTIGKLPFMGSKKGASDNTKVAGKPDPDALLTDDESPRKTADKSETPLGGSL